MREIYLRLGIERGLFGFAKSFEKQRFAERLYEHLPDKAEYGDNGESVMEAFDVAINILYKEWHTSSHLSSKRFVHVLINFNKDYSTWKVLITTFDKDFQMKHEDFDSSIKQEENQILEKYGFVAEEPSEKKHEVSFRGSKKIMSEEQYEDFIKDVSTIYPSTCHAQYVDKPLEQL